MLKLLKVSRVFGFVELGLSIHTGNKRGNSVRTFAQYAVLMALIFGMSVGNTTAEDGGGTFFFDGKIDPDKGQYLYAYPESSSAQVQTRRYPSLGIKKWRRDSSLKIELDGSAHSGAAVGISPFLDFSAHRSEGLLLFRVKGVKSDEEIFVSLMSRGRGAQKVENRISLNNFVDDAADDWTLVQIPLSSFGGEGVHWDGQQEVRMMFNWGEVIEFKVSLVPDSNNPAPRVLHFADVRVEDVVPPVTYGMDFADSADDETFNEFATTDSLSEDDPLAEPSVTTPTVWEEDGAITVSEADEEDHETADVTAIDGEGLTGMADDLETTAGLEEEIPVEPEVVATEPMSDDTNEVAVGTLEADVEAVTEDLLAEDGAVQSATLDLATLEEDAADPLLAVEPVVEDSTAEGSNEVLVLLGIGLGGLVLLVLLVSLVRRKPAAADGRDRGHDHQVEVYSSGDEEHIAPNVLESSAADHDLSGSLQRMPINEVIQFIHASCMTGTLSINAPGYAKALELYVQDGEIREAMAGKKSGEEAIQEILQCTQGDFAFVRRERKKIERSTMSILMEACQHMDEAHADDDDGSDPIADIFRPSSS